MDSLISKQETRAQRSKILLIAGLACVALLVAAWGMRTALAPSLKRSDIRIAVVENGDVEHTLHASGEIQPEFEQVITSPIPAILDEVFFNTGATVRKGDRILALDKSLTELEFEKQQDELELQRNGIVKIKLDLDKSYFDLLIQDSIKACRIASLTAELESARRLYNAGGGTKEAIEQASTNLQIARLEKRQLENEIRSRQQVMQASIRESEIRTSIQEKALMELDHKLRQADILAVHPGVLTYVNARLGSRISEGEVLARIADLGAYKVLGAVSDNYAEQLLVGMPAIIRLPDGQIRGKLVNIHPEVSNNVIRFDVALDDKSGMSGLRPQMQVELYLITQARQNVVRVANGPAFRGGAVQEIFVLRPDGRAERRTVKVGLSNFDYVEITEGLYPGESIILSDMSDYRNVREIAIH